MTKALAIVIVLLLAALGWQWGRAEHAGRQADTYQTERDTALAQVDAERKARAEEAAERRIEQARAKRLQENLDAEHLARLDNEAAARRAAAADASLRSELARLANRARAASADPAAAAEREAALAAVPVLTEMLGQCSERRTELARFADDAHLAGLTCQRAYDSLTLKEQP